MRALMKKNILSNLYDLFFTGCSLSLKMKNNTDTSLFINLQEIKIYKSTKKGRENLYDENELTSSPTFPLYLEILANSEISEAIDLDKILTSNEKYQISFNIYDSVEINSKKVFLLKENDRRNTRCSRYDFLIFISLITIFSQEENVQNEVFVATQELDHLV